MLCLAAACVSPVFLRAPGGRELDKQCTNGSGAACRDLAFVIRGLDGGIRDEVLPYFRKGCELNDPQACTALAYYVGATESPPSEKRWATKQDLYDCDQGVAPSCARVARAFLEGNQIKQDLSIATGLYLQACELGDPTSCYEMSLAIAAGRFAVQRNVDAAAKLLVRAVELYEAQCRSGRLDTCVFLETLYSNGNPVPVHIPRVLQLRKQLCLAGRTAACATGPAVEWPSDGGTTRMLKCATGDATACWETAYDVRHEPGLIADSARAGAIDDWACANGSLNSCSSLADELLGDGGLVMSPSRVFDLYRKACDLGDRWHCYELAHALTATHQDPVASPVHARAASLYAAACEAGEADSCRVAISYYVAGVEVPRKPAWVVQVLDAMCTRGDVGACSDVGRAYRHGVGVVRDIARGVLRLDASCRKEPNPRDCEELALMHRAGQEVARHDSKASEYRELSRSAQRALATNACPKCVGKYGVWIQGGAVCELKALNGPCVESETALDRYVLFRSKEIVNCWQHGLAPKADPKASVTVRLEFPTDGGMVGFKMIEERGQSTWLTKCVLEAMKTWSADSIPRGSPHQSEYKWATVPL